MRSDMKNLDSFTRALREICADDPLREKWLVAPSLRVAQQWADRVARSGQPVLNAHPKTLRGIAMQLAAPGMAERGLEFLGRARSEVLLDGLFGRLRSTESGALTALSPSTSLTETLHRTIRDIRLAGLGSNDMRAAVQRRGKVGGLFDDLEKGAQIIRLLEWYEAELTDRGIIDYAGALGLAAAYLRDNHSDAVGDALLVIPNTDVEVMRGLESSFWASVPERSRLVLPADRPAEGTETEAAADLDLLRWLPRPADAPEPRNDGSLSLFRASGEVNEVREVLRRCVKGQIPFDAVEIAHADYRTYVPLIYEQLSRMEFAGEENLPVTFEEGLPASFFRPGRALSAWASWVADGYPQQTLVRMVQDGLLEIPGAKEHRFGYGRLGTLLRAVAIREGRERYVPGIDTKIDALKARLAGADDEKEEEGGSGLRANMGREMEGLELLRPLVEGLVDGSPAEGCGQRDALSKAREFLTAQARCVSREDAYARNRLLKRIEELVESLEECVEVEGLDFLEWLHSLAKESQVGGQGPAPGCIYVTNLGQAGHSGRAHTFILGLDDRRFPGAGLQDPLLLDGERAALSTELSTASDALERKVRAFNQLAARLRGHATFSYSCRDLADDREASYPASVVASAYRLLSGEKAFEQEEMEEWLGPAAAFAPLDEEQCIDSTEWWIWRTCAAASSGEARDVVMEAFPHLECGERARLMRESADFTNYDGYVPEAALDPEVNPALEGSRLMSPRRLEAFGRCPMNFFFEHVLMLRPPEEYLVDPTVWLDVRTRGILLHAVFKKLLSTLKKRGERADFARHWPELKIMLDEEVGRYRAEVPPPLARVSTSGGGVAYAQSYYHDLMEFEKVAKIFLDAEARGRGRGLPLYFEVAIGFESHEEEGTELDTPLPVAVHAGFGKEAKRIALRGQVDRVDFLRKTKDRLFYAVWDYKTMGGSKYRTRGPFNNGRYLQGAIYPRIIESRLREVVGEGATVERFGYIFPTKQVWGEPISWNVDELAGGDRTLWLLCELLGRGCFVCSPEQSDMNYSSCTEAFGDIEKVVEQAVRKLGNAADTAIEPFRELREIDAG